jgi:SAM-dependent methyltransferase
VGVIGHGPDLDDPGTTIARRRVLREKRFLCRTYEEWYDRLVAALPPGSGRVLELGSGGGFLTERLPDVITSDVLPLPHVSVVLDAAHLPFASGTLRGILMTNVLHHLRDVRRFLAEAARCLRPGGVAAMLEPWVTPWSRLVYGRLHHEPFSPDAHTWEFNGAGPLSDANSALPWILFERDRAQFEREFPELRIIAVEPCMPIRYLASGGFAVSWGMPGWTYEPCRLFERMLGPLERRLAMFARIVLVRTPR